jgi:poly(hydroxyalkanoate) depolymerase family esterase
MRGITDTIARLAATAKRAAMPTGSESIHLLSLGDFGSNPGALDAFIHLPAGMPPQAPLVVVLHGCTQTAGGYDAASGWSTLANEQGFALLYPGQRRSNNPNNCFNWFEASDTRRDSGEVLSIRQMIEAVVARHAIDPNRIFITGLSAGAAMAATMLATYPGVFAGGAIIAGLPYGVASGMIQAFDRMRGHGMPSPVDLRKALRVASDHQGSWPRIAVWHGDADATVSPTNADAVVEQWRGVHMLADEPSGVEQIDNMAHRYWHDADGRVVLEDFRIARMGHGTPIKASGAGAYGAIAPYMLDVGISSTLRIASSWQIVGLTAATATSPNPPRSDTPSLPARIMPRRLHGMRVESVAAPSSMGAGKVIEDALRAAGLMK